MTEAALPEPFMGLELPLSDRREGKVRLSWALPGNRRLLVTTDRLSAFDRVLAGVPWKGQVLNQLAAWWFTTTRDLVANHLLSTPDENATVAVAATPLPVEVVVRGHITGVTDTSLWTRYAAGARVIDGHRLPEGLRKNEPLPAPIITPTTKAADGGHDEPLSRAEVVERGLVEARQWDQVCDAALAVFDRGRAVAEAAGLILADTKYEFGLAPDGELLLIDEVHTPDSSRFWERSSYDERLRGGDEPESLDKEPVRRAFAELGYRGHGDPPAVPAEVWSQTSQRYIHAYERLTGSTFERGAYPVAARLVSHLTQEGIL
jgi:phosphoribosylaminoimidazole-succinocarboxamide synthase